MVSSVAGTADTSAADSLVDKLQHDDRPRTINWHLDTIPLVNLLSTCP
jgi:hypothetical protein